MTSQATQAEPIRALVLCGYGLNCDHETAHALELAGARADRVHINSLIDGSVSLDDYRIMVFVGGFSWGDDHGAGVIQAVRMKGRMGDSLLDFVAAGKLVMGICNGFQVLVNLGLLPGFDGDYRRRTVALTYNDCGNFRDQWVHLRAETASPCVFTQGLTHLELPVRHGEGKFYASPEIIDRLGADGQIALKYAGADGSPAGGRFPNNPNGSVADIAGICDPTGRVFGLMPHPESFNHWTTHPDWTRICDRARREGRSVGDGPTPGTQMFINAVNYF
ncbi:MAG: phosphoribosylformylglycinamidine synthase subunit PurQ [Desulfobacterales bacterium]|nr:phosphoribosylformylglycinamidine synthase subunit PurQ [Desulfobacterales bacterium]